MFSDLVNQRLCVFLQHTIGGQRRANNRRFKGGYEEYSSDNGSFACPLSSSEASRRQIGFELGSWDLSEASEAVAGEDGIYIYVFLHLLSLSVIDYRYWYWHWLF